MSLYLKNGEGEARVFGLSTGILLAVTVAEGIYREMSADCYVTAGIDGAHTEGSSHYCGNAVDLRTSMFSGSQIAQVLAELKRRLTSDYFAQIEKDHIHIQFKPMHTYTGASS